MDTVEYGEPNSPNGTYFVRYYPNSSQKYAPAPRHNNNLNILYVDGHAASKNSTHSYYGTWPNNVYVDLGNTSAAAADAGYAWTGGM